MSGTWSQTVEQRYNLQLPEDVRAWLDQEVWQDAGGAEFCRARTPDQLLDPEPGTIWAGFMLPDTLPILGNDYGDWLCLRIAGDGTLSEIIHWSHCGGDWIPYGHNLAEALLYDAAQKVIDPTRPHMVQPQVPDEHVFRLAEWASQWFDGLPHFWNEPVSESAVPGDANGTAVLDLLGRRHIAEFAVQRDRILRHLESPLKAASEPSSAKKLGVAWEPDFVRWLFDTDLISERDRSQLQQSLTLDETDLYVQDWVEAEREAKAVIHLRQDLGWSFDVAGWAAQRRGDWDAAIRYYLAGLQTSGFSDDTVRFRTHWFEEGYGKFAASQLAALQPHLTMQQRNDPYASIFLDNDPQTLRSRVHEYWMGLAQASEQQGEFTKAYQLYYRAGWDLGLQPINGYGQVFDGLRRSATAAGMPALAAIAQMHQQFLINGV